MKSNDNSAPDSPSRKPAPLRRIARLLARHQRETDRARVRYSKADEILDLALALGAPLGVPIELPGGCVKIIRDQFAEKNSAFKATKVSRYVIEPYRPGKTKEGGK